MPHFPLIPTHAALTAVSSQNAGVVGNLQHGLYATIYGNRYWPKPLFEAFLVPNRTRTVFGDQAAAEWGISDGDEILVMFYTPNNRGEVNGYKTRVIVTSLFRNPTAVFLSWDRTDQFFQINRNTPGAEHLLGKQPPLGKCICVFYP